MTLYVAFFGAALFLMSGARGRYLFGFAAVLCCSRRTARSIQRRGCKCKAFKPRRPRAKRGVLRAFLIGMGLMIPCLSVHRGQRGAFPWPLYERNRLALAILTPLCLALLLLLRRAAKAACF